MKLKFFIYKSFYILLLLSVFSGKLFAGYFQKANAINFLETYQSNIHITNQEFELFKKVNEELYYNEVYNDMFDELNGTVIGETNLGTLLRATENYYYKVSLFYNSELFINKVYDGIRHLDEDRIKNFIGNSQMFDNIAEVKNTKRDLHLTWNEFFKGFKEEGEKLTSSAKSGWNISRATFLNAKHLKKIKGLKNLLKAKEVYDKIVLTERLWDLGATISNKDFDSLELNSEIVATLSGLENEFKLKGYGGKLASIALNIKGILDDSDILKKLNALDLQISNESKGYIDIKRKLVSNSINMRITNIVKTILDDLSYLGTVVEITAELAEVFNATTELNNKYELAFNLKTVEEKNERMATVLNDVYNIQQFFLDELGSKVIYSNIAYDLGWISKGIDTSNHKVTAILDDDMIYTTTSMQGKIGDIVYLMFSSNFLKDYHKFLSNSDKTYKVYYNGNNTAVGKYENAYNAIKFTVLTNDIFSINKISYPLDSGYEDALFPTNITFIGNSTSTPDTPTNHIEEEIKTYITNVELDSETAYDNSIQSKVFTKIWTFKENIEELGFNIEVIGNTYRNLIYSSDFVINDERISVELTPNTDQDINKIDLKLKNKNGDYVTVSDKNGNISDIFWSKTLPIEPLNLFLICKDIVVDEGNDEGLDCTAKNQNNQTIKPTYKIEEYPNNGTILYKYGMYFYKPNIGFSGNDNFRIKASYSTEERISFISVTVNKKEVISDNLEEESLSENPIEEFIGNKSFEIIPRYLKSNNTFEIKWQLNNINEIELFFSYYQYSDYESLGKLNQSSQSKVFNISRSERKEKIYFKTRYVSNGKIITSTGKIFTYEPTSTTDDEDIITGGEIPAEEGYLSLGMRYSKNPDTFLYTYQASNIKNNKITVFTSFDNKVFTQLNTHTQSSVRIEDISINNSLIFDRIYFKFEGEGTNDEIFKITKIFDYSPISIEEPSTPRLTYIMDSEGTVKFSWNEDINANEYELMYATTKNSLRNDTGTTFNTSNNSYSIQDLIEDKNYYIKIRAINDRHVSPWSYRKEFVIEKENYPTFLDTRIYPDIDELNVSKTTELRWKAEDKDGDDLEYKVYWGEDKDNLKYHNNGWIEEDEYNLLTEGERELKPNTKYYWQVQVKEDKKDRNYYGGEFIKSPLYSFTTVNSGPDLAITNVVMTSDIAIDEWVSFAVTIKNNGNQIATDEDVKPYFIKAGNKIEFAAYKRGNMNIDLNPGDEETVIVKVQFSNEIQERTFTRYTYNSQYQETFTYDNRLGEGNNIILFSMDYNQFDVDLNAANDSKEYNLTYSLADNLPVIDYNKLTLNTLSNTKGDYRYILGWDVSYTVNAEDLIAINKYSLEYRTSENNAWKSIGTYTNNNSDITKMREKIIWTIPNETQYVTDTMQLRVKVYNPSGLYSSVISPVFKVFEDEIEVNEIVVDKSSYKLKEPIIVTYNTSSKYDVENFRLFLKQEDDGSEKLLEYNIGDELAFNEFDSIQFTVPNNSDLIGSKSYIEVRIRDINGAYKYVESSRFTINQNIDVPKPFNAYKSIFTKEYNYPNVIGKEKYGETIYPPDYGIVRNTKNNVENIKYDNNGIAHILISHKASWKYYYYTGGVDDDIGYAVEYYYLTYNLNTKVISSAVKIFGKSGEGYSSVYGENYEDFIINGDMILLLTRNEDTSKVKIYEYRGSSVTSSSAFTINNSGSGSLINYNNKTYLTYRTDADENLNRRLMKKEIYPVMSQSNMIVDEYLGSNIRINGNLIYFYSKGVFFELNDDFTVIDSTKEDMGVPDNYIIGDITIYDDSVKEVLLDSDQMIMLLNKDNSINNIIDILDLSGTSNRVNISVYVDEIIISYIDSNGSKQFKTVIYDRETKSYESVYAGNKANGTGHIYDISKITSDKQIIIGNPDGYYDASAQVITADLSNGLGITPLLSIEMTNTIRIGESIPINFTLSKENELLSGFKIYKVVGENSILLSTISDTSIRNYTYIQNDSSEKAVTIKVIATYTNAEESIAYSSFLVLGDIELNSFSTDKTVYELFDDIEFNWTSTGSNSNNTYSVYSQCNDETNWLKLFDTKDSSLTYNISNISGECKLKLVSDEKELILSTPIIIEGDLFKFKEEAFSPIGNYDISSNILKFKWDTWLKRGLVFNLHIKKEGEIEFTQIATTIDNEYLYEIDFEGSFEWKVDFLYQNKIISSPEFIVNINKIVKPAIISSEFIIEDGVSTINLELPSIEDSRQYIIYRSTNDENYYNIGTTNDILFKDINIKYGTTYTYYIIESDGYINSISSDKINIKAASNSAYEIVIDTLNNQVLSTNELSILFRPLSELNIAYESYEIKLGEDKSNMKIFATTQDRTILVNNLEFAKKYYIEITPIDYSGESLSSKPAKLTFTTGFDTRLITDKPLVNINEVLANSISLSWSSVANTDDYYICRSDNQGEYNCFTSVKNNSYLDEFSILSGDEYKYIIVARNGSKNSLSEETPLVRTPLDTYTRVKKDVEALVFDVIRLNNQSEGKISSLLNLINIGSNGSSIEWVSSNNSVIHASTGLVSSADEIKDIILIAIVKYGDVEDIKKFNLSVVNKQGEASEDFDNVEIGIGTTLLGVNVEMKSLTSEVKVAWMIKNNIWNGYSKDSSLATSILNMKYPILESSNDNEGLFVITDNNATVKSAKTTSITSIKQYQEGWSIHGTNTNIDVNDMECEDNTLSLGAVIKLKANLWSIYMPNTIVENIENFTHIYPNEGYMTWCKMRGE